MYQSTHLARRCSYFLDVVVFYIGRHQGLPYCTSFSWSGHAPTEHDPPPSFLFPFSSFLFPLSFFPQQVRSTDGILVVKYLAYLTDLFVTAEGTLNKRVGTARLDLRAEINLST